MDNFIIAFIIFLSSSFIARTMNEKSLKKLNQDQKAELLDLFSSERIYQFGILILIVILFLLNIKLNFVNQTVAYVIYIFLLISFVIITSVLAYKKLKKFNFPQDYIKTYITTTAIRFIGLILFLSILKL